MSQQAPPSIPPRPVRSKSPAAAGAPPTVPARPVRPGKPKASESDGSLPSPELSPEREPLTTTILSATTLHAPVAQPARPAPVPRASSEYGIPTSSASSVYRYAGSDAGDSSEGIPQFGRRVPMHPNAGDVQAPTPSETPSNNRKKHVYREEYEMDEGAYGTQKRQTPYSMSSTDLNAVVAHTKAAPGVSAGPSHEGVPDEELGYLASEEYVRTFSRAESPISTRSEYKSNGVNSDDGRDADDDNNNNDDNDDDDDDDDDDEDGSVIHLDAPAMGGVYRRGNSEYADSRAESVLNDDGTPEPQEQGDSYSILAGDEVLKRQQGQYMQAAITPRGSKPRSRPRSVVTQEDDDESDKLSIDIPKGLESRGSLRTPYEELSPTDENAKPLFSESEGEDEEEDHHGNEKEPKPRSHKADKLKRPTLNNEHRFPSRDVWEDAPEHSQLQATIDTPPAARGTPVGREEEEEEEEKEDHNPEGMSRARGRSEPELEYVQGQPNEHYAPGDEFEHEQKEKEKLRTDQDYQINLSDLPEDERLQRLVRGSVSDETSDQAGGRGSQRRKFPSNDIWEDCPPSLDLQTTIDSDPIDKDRATTGTITEAAPPPPPPPPPTTGAPVDGPPASSSSSSSSGGSGSGRKPGVPARPAVPTRPQREKKVSPAPEISDPDKSDASERDKAAPPNLPDRPKPKVPARPAKPAVLARAPGAEEKPQAAEAKSKPAVPARHGGGSKIAALKAGLGDLESKLRLGPFAPKKEEKQEEKKKGEVPAEDKEPLTDVRKSRARGPRGRKLPTKEEKRVGFATPLEKPLELVGTWTVFTLDEDLDAVVINNDLDEPPEIVEKDAAVMEDKPRSPVSRIEGQEKASIAATTTVATTTPPVAGGTEHPEDAVKLSAEDAEGPKTPGPSRSATLVEGARPQDLQLDEVSLSERLEREV